MASIVKRGKTYSLIYYEGEGKNRHQVWESGLSYNAAKARKAQLEYEVAQNIHVDRNDLTVSEFLYEFIEKYGERKWVASTYDGNVGLLENYVHPYLGDKKLRSIRTKTIDDYYHFLLFSAEPVAHAGRPKREKINPSLIHDIHKVMRCAFNQAVKWEYIAKNPFLNATLPEHKERKRQALTPEQLHKVLEFTDRPDIYDYYLIHCAIHLAFACSMRGGEVGGAQWERFDMENQMLYIDRVIDRVDKKLMEKLSKMEVLFKFPNLYPGTRTVIVLKQPKTEGSIRNVYTPDTVTQKLMVLKRMQEKLKGELGSDGYMDYGLIICQANGRPIMTEHLNKRFKEILVAMGDPDIAVDDIVFHSIRHTSAGVKLRLSKGDLKAVQGDGGWNTPDMVTKRYAHILDEDRKSLAAEMEAKFYQGSGSIEAAPAPKAAPAIDAASLASLLASNPDLLTQVLQSVQFANKA
ncbi:MAG: tyrosine-type recombinase/integrase [Clostridia bacterium]|nr:tyrosine-type recombinase/integrase [Clostridia bacterium]